MKKYTSSTYIRQPRPRSKRLLGLGVGGSWRSITQVYIGETKTSEDNYANNPDLDLLKVDDDYLLILKTIGEDENIITQYQKAKAGDSDMLGGHLPSYYATQDSLNSLIAHLASMWKMDDDGNVWTDRNVYSTKNISAGGPGEEGDSASGTVNAIQVGDTLYEPVDGVITLPEFSQGETVESVTALSGLTDVSLSSLTNQDLLIYDSASGKWKNVPQSSLLPDLTGYATESWVKQQGFLTATALNDYATQEYVTGLGYITATSVAGTYATKEALANEVSALDTAIGKKQDMITDLATIRSNATNGNTAYGWGNHANAGYALATNLDAVSNRVAALETYFATSEDSDSVINKWNEIVTFIDGTEGTTLEGILAGYVTTAEFTTLSNEVGTISEAVFGGDDDQGDTTINNLPDVIGFLAGYSDETTLVDVLSAYTTTANLKTLTIQRNGVNAGTYRPTEDATINIADVASAATLSSHIGNRSNPHEVTKAQVDLGNVENIALSTWAGSSKITTLGTITNGTWNGTAIANDYIAYPYVTIAENKVRLGESLSAATLTTSLNLDALIAWYTAVKDYFAFDSENNAVYTTWNLYSTRQVSSGGASDADGEGGIGTGVALLDSWDDVPEDLNGYALGAALGVDLHERVAALESGTTAVSYVSALGSGIPVGTLTIDNEGYTIFAPSSYAWSAITNTPTTLGGYGITDAVYWGSHIDMSANALYRHIGYGYIVDGWLNNGPAMTFGVTGYTHQIQGKANNADLYHRAINASVAGSWYTILDERNYGIWAVTLSTAQTITGEKTFGSRLFVRNNAQGSIMITGDDYAASIGFAKEGGSAAYLLYRGDYTWAITNEGWTGSAILLHSGNYNTYAPTLAGAGATGTWGISITGTAATATKATKLANAVKIYGKSFDGTADIDYQIYLGGLLAMHRNQGSEVLYIGYTGDVGYQTQYYGNKHTFYTGIPSSCHSVMTIMDGAVGIGTSAPSYALDIKGGLHATEAVKFESTLSLGSYLSFGYAGAEISSDPSSSFRTTIFGDAEPGSRLRTFYAATGHIGQVAAQYGVGLAWATSGSHAYINIPHSIYYGSVLVGGGNGDVLNWSARLYHSKQHLVPDAAGTYQLGSSDVRWSDVYANNLNVNGTSVLAVISNTTLTSATATITTASISTLKIGSITLTDDNGSLKIEGNAYTTGHLSAGGAAEEGEEDTGGVTLDHDSIVSALGYTPANETDLTSAVSRIAALEVKSTSVSFSQTITSGTKIGAITIDGTSTNIYAPTIPSTLPNPYSLTFGTKTYNGSAARTITAEDLGALTEHQTIWSLKVVAGSTEVLEYTPNSGTKTLTFVAGSNITLTPDTGTNRITIAASSVSDTKNTAGSTNTSSKIYLIGATTQADNPVTYSHDTAYVGTDGCLYSGGSKVLTAHQTIYGLTMQSGAFSGVTYAPNSAPKTVNIPTTTSHISEGTNLYFTNARAVSAVMGSDAIGSTSSYVYWTGTAWATKSLGSLAFSSTAYAGGTAVTLNGTSKAAATASFYAPTGSGTSGYWLKSNGSGSAPTWASMASLKTALGIDAVENQALSTWTGSENITKLGTVTTGTWNGSTIDVAHGGTGRTTLTSGYALVGNGTDAVCLWLISSSVTSGSDALVTSGAVYDAVNAVRTYLNSMWSFDGSGEDIVTSTNVAVNSLYSFGTIDVSPSYLKVRKIYAPTTAGGTTYGYGSNGYVLKSNGTYVYWAADDNTTYAMATASVPGLVKPVSVITKPTLNSVTTTSGRYYQVQMSVDGNMFVNVPWVASESTSDSGSKWSVAALMDGNSDEWTAIRPTSYGTIGVTRILPYNGTGEMYIGDPGNNEYTFFLQDIAGENEDAWTITTDGAATFTSLKVGGVSVVTLSGTQALTNKTYNGYTLAAACAKGVTDSTSASALSTGTNLVTERDVYYGLASINGARQTSSVSVYAPTSAGTSGQVLVSTGSGAPSWTAMPTSLPNTYSLSWSINGSSDQYNGAISKYMQGLYAPTTAGSSGQILKSNGSGAPTWVNPSTLCGWYYEGSDNLTSDVETVCACNIHADSLRTSILYAPTTSGGSTYGIGTSGQVLMTNGSTVYWGTVAGGGSFTGGTVAGETTFTGGVNIASKTGMFLNLSANNGGLSALDLESTPVLCIDSSNVTGITALYSDNRTPLIVGETSFNQGFKTVIAGTVVSMVYATSAGVKVVGLTLNQTGIVAVKALTQSSDMRRKVLLSDASLSLDSIAQAPVFRFSYTEDEDTVYVGSSAQYWQSLLPDAIKEDMDGYLSMDYGSIALASVVSVAKRTLDHEDRIAELERTVKTQAEEIASLRNQLS